MAQTLVLVDGHSLVYRAYHATPPLTNARTGEPTNATFGFASMLFKALGDIKPDGVAVTFDRSAPTFRHLEYDQYKATRASQPDDLRPQFRRVRQLIDALGIPVYEMDGYEADDVLGTLSRQAEERGIASIILTGDTDALQLVSPLTRVLTSRRGFSDTITYDEAAVKERYGLNPSQLVDFKALKGDTSDNIPGVPGVGEKTAAKLISEWGSLEGVYEHLDRLPAKQRALLEQHRDLAFQGQRLCRIVRDVPLELDVKAIEFDAYDRGKVVDFLREMEFNSLVTRLPQPTAASVEPPKPPQRPENAQLALFGGAAEDMGSTIVGLPLRLVRSEEALADLLAALASATAGFSLRTVGDDSTQPMRAQLVGLAFAAGGCAWYVPLGHTGDGADQQLPRESVLDRLRPLLEDAARPKFGHNAKYDQILLSQSGVALGGVVGDAMLAAYLREANLRAFSVKDLAFSKLGLEIRAVQAVTGTGRSAILLGAAPVDDVARFAGDEVSVIEPLRDALEPGLHEMEIWPLYAELELPLSAVLARMEECGVAVDTALLAELSKSLGERIADLERRAYAAVGHEFNLGSPVQLGQVLFEELKLPGSKRTKTGYSTDASVLDGLRGVHEVVDLVLEHRQLTKLKGTYVDAIPLLVNPKTGRVHTTFNQTGAVTGRLSSSDPNLQNIPVRTELGRSIRKAFVAGRPDHVIFAADYSQVELRILAHVSHDEALIAAFSSGRDIHTATAMDMFDVGDGEVTADQRRIAKTLNFAIIYGVSDFGLSENLLIPRKLAAEYMDRYAKRYPGVTAYMAETLRRAKERGYVETLLGRRRYIPELNAANPMQRKGAERMAINAPIQGTAADIIKRAMIQLQPKLDEGGFESRLILQVHDELVFEAPTGEVDRLKTVVRDTMQNAFQLDVPLLVEVKSGPNWEEAQ